MEDIKEQDSEQDSVQHVKKEAPVVQAPQVPSPENEQVQAKINNLTDKKQKL